MAIRFADRVKVRSLSTGTGDFVLGSVIPGFQSFAAIGDGNQTYYCITDAIGNWEIGLGTYDQDSTQEILVRDTVLDSSSNGLRINFPVGGKTVAITQPAIVSQTVVDGVGDGSTIVLQGEKGDPGPTVTYDISAWPALDGAYLRLSGNDASTDNVKLASGSNVTVTQTDADTITIDATSSLKTRNTTGISTGVFDNGSTVNASAVGYKGYMLLTVQVSAAARVRIYTDTASRTADASRVEGASPAAGHGLIYELVTTGSAIRKVSPAVMGYSDETIPTVSIPIAVTNKSGSPANISVTLTILQIEQ
jgi:hypothetical protein